ncbi:MAG: hypothetical protein ACTTJ7_04590, partial [Treponema sp.]
TGYFTQMIQDNSMTLLYEVKNDYLRLFSARCTGKRCSAQKLQRLGMQYREQLYSCLFISACSKSFTVKTYMIFFGLTQRFRIIKPARLFRGNPPVYRIGVAYDKAASSLLL